MRSTRLEEKEANTASRPAHWKSCRSGQRRSYPLDSPRRSRGRRASLQFHDKDKRVMDGDIASLGVEPMKGNSCMLSGYYADTMGRIANPISYYVRTRWLRRDEARV